MGKMPMPRQTPTALSRNWDAASAATTTSRALTRIFLPRLLSVMR